MSPKKIIAGADEDPKSPENKPTEAAEALKQANIGPLDDESLTTLAEMPSEDIWVNLHIKAKSAIAIPLTASFPVN